MIRRYEISDADWKRIEPLVKGKPGDVGRSGVDNRLFINAIIWLARSGAAWRDLPERYGPWNSIYRRFRPQRRTVLGQIGPLAGHFQSPARPGPGLGDARFDYRARPSTGGGSKKSTAADEALGRSRGGLTTKIHAVVDALGNPLRVGLTPGQWADSPQALGILKDIDCQAVIADKAYDTNALVETLAYQQIEVVIPPKTSRLDQRAYDENLYADRNKIERFFHHLKGYRRIATRYDKTACSFLAFIQLACALIWLR